MLKKDFLNELDHLGVPKHMLNRAAVGLRTYWQPIEQLFSQRALPERGWTDEQIIQLLEILNKLDSDKDPNAFRIGEREGRVSTSLLNRYSAGFCHGIGRSGELQAPQPKAAGASLMQSITNKLLLQLVKKLGLTNIKSAMVTPFGTGMSLGLALRGLSDYYKIDLTERPYVIITRIDHKSPYKGLKYVGAKLLEVQSKFNGNYYAPEGVSIKFTDIEKIYEENKDKISAIVSTTTFFAPRLPDDVKTIAKFAEKNNIIHIVNNAYGLQAPEILNIINRAIDAGRVDAIIQSTDKNLLTPVGGGIILSPKKEIIKTISQSYAGRASASPVLHVLVSLLSLGKQGYFNLIEEQKKNRHLLENKLKKLANLLDEKIINCKNPVSCAMTLKNFSDEQVEHLGGYLYNLRVTGPRVLQPKKKTFGTCTEEINFPYVVMNAAIGSKQDHIIGAVDKLKKSLEEIKTKYK